MGTLFFFDFQPTFFFHAALGLGTLVLSIWILSSLSLVFSCFPLPPVSLLLLVLLMCICLYGPIGIG